VRCGLSGNVLLRPTTCCLCVCVTLRADMLLGPNGMVSLPATYPPPLPSPHGWRLLSEGFFDLRSAPRPPPVARFALTPAHLLPLHALVLSGCISRSRYVCVCVCTRACVRVQVIMGTDRQFTFDSVLGPERSQEETYKVCAVPLLAPYFDGFNSTVIAYGQTGALQGRGWARDGTGRDGARPTVRDGGPVWLGRGHCNHGVPSTHTALHRMRAICARMRLVCA
jgi:hypothetical protein